MEYIEKAFIEAREGRPATRPFSDGVIPTAFDKTLCPDGTHIMSLFTQWVPADWSKEPHRDELEKYADRMIDVYNEVGLTAMAQVDIGTRQNRHQPLADLSRMSSVVLRTVAAIASQS